MGDIWRNLFPENFGNSSLENISIDVAVKGCFNHFDTTACIRNSLLAFLGFLTLSLCIIRIIRLHFFHHPHIHQYLIFYTAILEVINLILKWLVNNSLYQLEFTAFYLKMIQFILLCHFHWSLVSRILHQKRLITCVIIPLLIIFFVFLTTITVSGIMSHYSSWIECLAPHWLLLSAAEFLGVQLYVLAGVYITKKINSISSLDSFKREQKRDLWSVIATYEFASVISLSYYATLKIVGNCESGCSGVFDHVQEIYSPVYATFMIIKYLLPIWVMLLVFYPIRGCLTNEDKKFLGWSGDGSFTSTFNSGSRGELIYKQLSMSASEGEYSRGYGTLRRSASSPALFSKPHLTAIKEEDSLLPPSQVTVNYGAVGNSLHSPMNFPSTSRARSHHDSRLSSRDAGRRNRLLVSLNQSEDAAQGFISADERA